MYSTHRNTTVQNMGYTSSGYRITPAPGTYRNTSKSRLDRPAKPASDKQIDLLTKLLAELVTLVEVPETPSYTDSEDVRNIRILQTCLDPEWVGTLTLQAASNAIDTAIKMLPKLRRQASNATRDPKVTDGVYFKDGAVIKVQKAVHGSGHLYAKRLVLDVMNISDMRHQDADPEYQARWEYTLGLINTLTVADKMTLEQAAEFGRLYGVCCVCGATLTNETSIELGIGPVCRSRLV